MDSKIEFVKRENYKASEWRHLCNQRCELQLLEVSARAASARVSIVDADLCFVIETTGKAFMSEDNFRKAIRAHYNAKKLMALPKKVNMTLLQVCVVNGKDEDLMLQKGIASEKYVSDMQKKRLAFETELELLNREVSVEVKKDVPEPVEQEAEKKPAAKKAAKKRRKNL